MAQRIPEADTEPHEPSEELSAPPVPVRGQRSAPTSLTFFDHTRKDPPAAEEIPTLDLPPAPEERAASESQDRIFATWDESKEYFVAPIRAVPQRVDGRIQWLILLVVILVSAQLGGWAAQRLVPLVLERQNRETLTYQRLQASARSVAAARRMNLDVPPAVEHLQREAETAAFSGDVDSASAKLDAIAEAWR